MNEKIKHFKLQLARVFDDDLRTEQWQNYVDYAIMSLIGLSTFGIFLSTYDNIVAKYGLWLDIIDYFTLAVFTVEVTLRIWCADLIDDKYKGVMGRVRYCLSFYGLMDVLSTYTFYLALVFPIPYMTFKVLRVARLFRVFRYIKAFNVLARAIRSKKNEMLVSLQFLCIITLMLSFILYFVEHEAQPEVYDNGWTSVIWAFAQYIGDPGGFAETPPITFWGRIIACIIGVLGIAIFAVPAGLIGSAFTEVMEEDARQQNAKEWAQKLHLAFERKLDRPTGFQIAPRYASIVDIQARLGLKEDEIMDAIAGDNHFRLINLAATQPADMHPQDKLAVEHYALNTPYGQCIDRGSKVTIFVPSGMIDPVTGWWGYYLAKIGGFNFICRELGEKRPYRTFYQYKPEQLAPHQQDCMDDLNRLLCAEDHWVFVPMAASGANEPEYPTQFHFGYGAAKGDETYNDPNITLNDKESFQEFYQSFSQLLEEKYHLQADKQRYHNNTATTLFCRHLDTKVNAVTLRIAWSVTCWDMRAMQIAEDLAKEIHSNILHTEYTISPEMKIKDIAYDGYSS